MWQVRTVSLAKGQDVASWNLCSGMRGPSGQQPPRSPQRLLSGLLSWGGPNRAFFPFFFVSGEYAPWRL